MSPVLLGNSFPLSLIRRPVIIEPRPLADLQRAAAKCGFLSFWGHSNTLSAARSVLGFDPTPPVERPALKLDDAKLPSIGGQTFSEVWVLSPDYFPGFRPKIGEEVSSQEIRGWEALRVQFPP